MTPSFAPAKEARETDENHIFPYANCRTCYGFNPHALSETGIITFWTPRRFWMVIPNFPRSRTISFLHSQNCQHWNADGTLPRIDANRVLLPLFERCNHNLHRYFLSLLEVYCICRWHCTMKPQIHKLAKKYPNAGRLRSSSRYPWGIYNSRCLGPFYVQILMNTNLADAGSHLVVRSLSYLRSFSLVGGHSWRSLVPPNKWPKFSTLLNSALIAIQVSFSVKSWKGYIGKSSFLGFHGF